MRKTILLMTMIAALLLTGCRTAHYHLTGVERTRIAVDSRYDVANPAVDQLMAPYRTKVDELMKPVVGRTASYLDAYKPESPLSNLLTDIMVWSGKFYDEKPDFGVYNIGGMRASLPAGDVTIGDVVNVAPFENKVAFVTLTGAKVRELMEQIASRGGEGVSREVRMVITSDNKLKSVQIGGQDIDPARQYRIATIDYVSKGNDDMTAFKSGTDIKMPDQDKDLNREIIMRYFREKAQQGELVNGELDGRIKVED
jgi:2',3'-cyclic-nucleotide 2'-phosphodiesterase (5'-nucleotidase family)